PIELVQGFEVCAVAVYLLSDGPVIVVRLHDVLAIFHESRVGDGLLRLGQHARRRGRAASGWAIVQARVAGDAVACVRTGIVGIIGAAARTAVIWTGVPTATVGAVRTGVGTRVVGIVRTASVW